MKDDKYFKCEAKIIRVMQILKNVSVFLSMDCILAMFKDDYEYDTIHSVVRDNINSGLFRIRLDWKLELNL